MKSFAKYNTAQSLSSHLIWLDALPLSYKEHVNDATWLLLGMAPDRHLAQMGLLGDGIEIKIPLIRSLERRGTLYAHTTGGAGGIKVVLTLDGVEIQNEMVTRGQNVLNALFLRNLPVWHRSRWPEERAWRSAIWYHLVNFFINSPMTVHGYARFWDVLYHLRGWPIGKFSWGTNMTGLRWQWEHEQIRHVLTSNLDGHMFEWQVVPSNGLPLRSNNPASFGYTARVELSDVSLTKLLPPGYEVLGAGTQPPPGSPGTAPGSH